MKKNYNPNPVIYATWYSTLRQIAIKHGYTACLHGSLLDDMDIVLVPWEQQVSNPLNMLTEMREATNSKLIYFHPIKVAGKLVYSPVLYPNSLDTPNIGLCIPKEFTPHGREYWALQINEDTYIDIYITPTIPPPLAEIEWKEVEQYPEATC